MCTWVEHARSLYFVAYSTDELSKDFIGEVGGEEAILKGGAKLLGSLAKYRILYTVKPP